MILNFGKKKWKKKSSIVMSQYMDLEELKANIALFKSTVKLDTRHYLVPNRKVIFYDFLTDSMIVESNEVYHYFYPPAPITLPFTPDGVWVIHNHPPMRSCTTSDFCHEFGYKPSEAHHPGFRKAFQLKNGHYYKEGK